MFFKKICVVLLLSAGVVTTSRNATAKYDPVWLESVMQYPSVSGHKTITSIFSHIEVDFRLYTRKNRYVYQQIDMDDPNTLKYSHFNVNLPIKVLAHGWYNNGSSPMPENIKEAYLNVTNSNIFVVDWARAANVNYVWASYNVASVGKKLTAFLDFLGKHGADLQKMHLIGHSLGAHVVGIAGAFAKGGPVGFISGLDPAMPLFSEGNKDARLDRHDATHVEVIHTCAGYLGFAAPIGHVDFYPNGGASQPGCGSDYRGFCAHNRAHRFFAESIVANSSFVGIRCSSYGAMADGCCRPTGETRNMGGRLPASRGKEGVYYLVTNGESPYALQKNRIF